MAKLALALAAIACGLLGLGGTAPPDTNGVPPLVAEIEAIAGAPGVPTTCTLDNPHLYGEASWPPVLIQIAPKVCFWLTRPLRRPAKFGVAVHVVVHESSHVALLSSNEYQVETRAQAMTPSVLTYLYVTRGGGEDAIRPMTPGLVADLHAAIAGSTAYHNDLGPNYLNP
jgi:hypothetical protein